MKKIDQIIKDQTEWVKQQILNNPYSEVQIILKLHDGRIASSQRTVTQKIKHEGDK